MTSTATAAGDMGSVLAGVLQLVALVGALALVHVPVGGYMARVYSSTRHLGVEKWIYRGIGADPDAQMRWPAYLRGVLAFSAVTASSPPWRRGPPARTPRSW